MVTVCRLLTLSWYRTTLTLLNWLLTANFLLIQAFWTLLCLLRSVLLNHSFRNYLIPRYWWFCNICCSWGEVSDWLDRNWVLRNYDFLFRLRVRIPVLVLICLSLLNLLSKLLVFVCKFNNHRKCRKYVIAQQELCKITDCWLKQFWKEQKLFSDWIWVELTKISKSLTKLITWRQFNYHPFIKTIFLVYLFQLSYKFLLWHKVSYFLYQHLRHDLVRKFKPLKPPYW